MKNIFKKSGRKKQLSSIFHDAGSSAFDKSEHHFRAKFLARIENLQGMKWMVLRWLLLVIVLIVVAVLQLAWYEQSFTVNSYKNGGNYHEGSVGEIKTMNPLYASSMPEKILAKLMFNGLVGADGAGGVSNVLAESIERGGDGRIWTVRLQKDLKWSDGEALTADDVLFTANLIQDYKAKSVLRSNLSNATIKKIDKDTLRFELPSAYAAFANNLDFPILPEHILGKIEPDKLYEDNFSKEPVGSGAFMLKSMQSAGKNQVVYLDRNPNYYRTNTKLATYTLSTFKTTNELKEAVENSMITGTGDLLDDEEIKNRAMQKRSVALSGGVFAFLNTQSDVLKHLEIRKAVRQGINVKNIRKEIEGDWPLDYPILERQISEVSYPPMAGYDQKEAKNKLSSLGVIKSGKAPTLKIAVPARKNLEKVAKNIANQLETLGFKTKLVQGTKDNSDFFADVVQPRNYDILVYEIDMGADPDPYPYYSSSQTGRMGVNYSNFKNTMTDDLLLSARSTLNTDLRRSKYEKFLEVWTDQVPAIGIYQSHMNYYFVKNVRVFNEDAILQSSLDRYYDINDWGVERTKKKQTP